MIDATLAALKFLAILLTGILGAIGLLVEYKDKEGRRTKWGTWALIGVITTSMVAAFIQGVEVYKQNREAKAAESRTREQESYQNQSLSEIRRAVYPLELPRDMYVTAEAVIPITDEGMAYYHRRLSDALPKLIQKARESEEGGNIRLEAVFDARTNRKTFDGVFLNRAASLFPRESGERTAWWILSDFGIEIDVYLKPAEPTKGLLDPAEYINPDGSRRHEPDLHFRATTEKDALRLEYSLKDRNSVRMSSERMLVSTDHNWHNPKNLSLPDLAGARMFIKFKDWVGKTDDEETIRLRVERAAKLIFIDLHVANRRYFISGFKSVVNSPYPVYVYTLPEKIMESDVNLPVEP